MLLIFSLTLLLVLLITPWLLARNLLPRADLVATLAMAGACLVVLAVGGTLLLHYSRIPITAASLSTVHGSLALVLTLITKLRSIPFRPPPPLPSSAFFGMILLFAILVLPFTPIAGIDTYKWQDLATVVQVDHSIPWLIHPISLLGFTPRSYSSAQPLVLATISIIGNTGVDWSFYILSLLFGITALAATTMLGRHLFPCTPTSATWMAFFYVFSPVFLRYNYWATGRGLFMVLLPFFVLALLKVNRLPGALAAVAMAPLLTISHRTGLVAIAVIPLAFLAGLVSYRLPLIGENRRWRFILPSLLLLLALAVGFSIVNHSPTQAAYRLVTRLAFLFPLAVVGSILIPSPIRITQAMHSMMLTALATLPLVFTEHMYGSLIAALFISALASLGLAALTTRLTLADQQRLHHATLALTLLTALIIITNQAIDSPSRDVVRAARFLERHDPLGPFRVEAPGLNRTRMQAYLSGCPRFSATASPQSTVKVNQPPPSTGNLRDDIRNLSDYLRRALTLSDSSTDWYGNTKKVYYVTISGIGMKPSNATLLFSSGNVSVYE